MDLNRFLSQELPVMSLSLSSESEAYMNLDDPANPVSFFIGSKCPGNF